MKNHYDKLGIDPIEIFLQNNSVETMKKVYEFNILKYIMREKGDKQKDLLKARDYLSRWIQLEELSKLNDNTEKI